MKDASTSPLAATMAFLEQCDSFYLSDLVKASGIERKGLLRVLEKLRKKGVLAIIEERKVSPQRGENGPYRRDPRYQLIGQLTRIASNRPMRSWQKVWRTLRHLRRATRTDIIRLTGCSYRTVEQYTALLAKHGYIRQAGKRDREKIWLLVKDVGAKAPEWGAVYDGKKKVSGSA